LRDRNIEYYEVVPMFFDPERSRTVPTSTPIAHTGGPMRQQGWYVGLCPTDPEYLEARVVAAEEIVQRLRPKGLYLDWIRFPGFWEMWLPETTRADILNYCFCPRCLQSFQAFSGADMRSLSVQDRAKVILHEMKRDWTEWKCSIVAAAVGAVKRGAQRQDPNIEIMTSNVAFGRADYENAIEEVLGQRVATMAQHADRLTFMFYHQIVRREPAAWISQLAGEIERQTSRPFLATLQLKPAYLEAQYAEGGRNTNVSSEELSSALQSVAASPADGVVLYHWSDYLEMDESEDRTFREAVRSFREGEAGT
jgi:hypothetical protein